jgi:Ca-activated chloride channel homolog
MNLFYPVSRLLSLCALAVIFTASLFAQMPSMKSNGAPDGSVYLQKLAVNVRIAGTLATTTWTMTFRNKSTHILEGELNFPLPAGISVSRYALDINGNMREAVPVTKEKGTLLFETVERRRVDPGILEKVEGNTFRTRIYPINPNGVRIVAIAYEQDLPADGRNELRYSLPLAFSHPIEDFGIDISVIHSAVRPLLEEQDNKAGLPFKEWKDVWSAAQHWSDYKADQSLTVRIPKPEGASEAMMEQMGNHYFFSASVYLHPEKIDRRAPKQLTILWDASLSGLTNHKKKELDLLDAYFARLKNVEVTLAGFSNTVADPKHFSVAGGQWKALRAALEGMVYDGATQFGALDLTRYPGDETLLFSDGHSTFGSGDIRPGNKPVYAIVSAAGADYPFLQSIANRTAGEVIDLENEDIDRARDQLLYQRLQYLGVRPVNGIEECYPSLPVPVTGSFTMAGMSFQPSQEIVLQFGYAGKVTMEQAVKLDFSSQQTDQPNLERVWAQKKIAELDPRYDDNRVEIEQLGRRYGIVTRNTSLIVLESVNDYITYDVEPPADLRGEYDRIMKQRGFNRLGSQKLAVNDAESYFNELLGWWKRPEQPVENKKEQNQMEIRQDTVERALMGRVAGVQVDRAAGIVGPGGNASAPRATRLDEVVVTGYSAQRRKDVVDEDMEEAGEPAPQAKFNGYFKSPGRGSFTAAAADENIDYLRQLKAAASADRYALYLQLRTEHLGTPLFYYRAADVFVAAGDKTAGLRILSNIAELETENYELYKMLGYKLKELGEAEEECAVFRRIIGWRPFEPQSYRDFGLALEDAGHYQQALDTLCYAITREYDENVRNLYNGIEETLVPEINELIEKHSGQLDIRRVPKTLIGNMPVDIRVVLNWNRPNTDIDLWVTDPNGEKCYYAHRFTQLGGRISHDFTRGLGPEQFLLRNALKGSYKVELNYFGDTQVTLAGETTIMAEIYTNYGTPQQRRQVVVLQMQRGANGAVYVGDFDFK